MRYLKLFEAFDSIKLSKTFSYLNKEGKDKFLTDLKSVCNYLDYPLSKLSDEDFQYLPFKRAWDLNNPEANKLEMIKFWFDKDGNYIDKTAINGETINVYENSISSDLPSDDLDDYIEISSDLPHSEVKNLQTGQLVHLRCSGGYGPAYIYKSPITDEVFAFQSFASGSTPNGRGDNYDHRTIARNSWVMTSSDDYYSVRKIQYKNVSEDDNDIVKVFNLKLDISEDNIYTSYDKKIEKKSNFALVLDLTKLPGISLKNIKRERVERKQGAFLTDEQIKSENIERYLLEIFKTEKVISDPNRVIKRLLIGNNILYFFNKIFIKDTMYSIKDLYYYAISEPNDQETYIQDLRNYLFEYNKKYNSLRFKLESNIKYLKKELSSGKEIGGEHSNEDYLEYLNNLEELSKIIYNKLSEIKIENIYDIEGIYNKLIILENILNDRRNHFRKSLNFIRDGLFSHENEVLKYYLIDSYENEGLLEFNKTGFNRIKELVKRL
jgi:hypothetical protein